MLLHVQPSNDEMSGFSCLEEYDHNTFTCYSSLTIVYHGKFLLSINLQKKLSVIQRYVGIGIVTFLYRCTIINNIQIASTTMRTAFAFLMFFSIKYFSNMNR